MKSPNFKKEREEKLNKYLITMWEIGELREDGYAYNHIINKVLDWHRPETDNISEYAKEIGYINIGESGLVFFTKRGLKRIEEILPFPEIEILSEEKPEKLIEFLSGEEKSATPKEKWHKKVFKRIKKWL